MTAYFKSAFTPMQVRLPRNQLYVQRVSPKAKIGDILHQVCKSRDFDESRYELRHPGM